MSSPFDVFRKHQKVGMVVLVFMAMFAFIVLDSFQRMSDMPTPVIAVALGLLLAGVFWFLGNQKGEGKQYALLGGIIGTCAGIIGPQLSRPEAPVLTSFGRMTERDLHLALAKRQVSNNFLDLAGQKLAERHLKTNPKATQFEVPRVEPNYYFGLFRRRSMFGQEFGPPPSEDVAMASIFLHEADQMGIKVSDDAVSKYIIQATGGKLSQEDYYDVLRRLGIDEAMLYDAMKEEIRAKLAFDQLQPRNFPTPEDYWQLYRKMNVRQELEFAAVPVSDFAKDIPDPSDAELAAYFAKYKDVQPTGEARPEPAFGTPRQVRVASVMADFQASEEKAAAAVDKEIAEAEAKGEPGPVDKYYETNKEQYRNRPIPESKPPVKPAEKGPDLFPETKPDDEKKPEDKKPEGDAKPEPEKKPAPDKEPEGEKKPEPEKKPEADKPESKPESKPDEPKSEGAGDSSSADELEEGALDGFEPEKKPEADAPKSDKKDEEAKPETKPESKPEAKADEARPESSPEAPAESADADAPATAEIPGEPLETEPAAPLPEFKELDDRLRADIRQILINERAEADLAERIKAAEDKMSNLADIYNEPVDETKGEKKKLTQQGLSDQLGAWAKEHGLAYSVSDLLTYEELANPDKNPIGQSTEPGGNPMQRRTVVDAIFGGRNPPKYLPAVSVDFGTGDRYCWWLVEDQEPRESKFEDPGMKEKVLEAWKIEQARKPAEQRAAALAEKVRKAGEKPLAEVLGGETVTGKEGGPVLAVHDSPAFSWLRRGQAPSMNPFMERPPELSRIPFVTNAGDEFMSTIFDKLKNGETGVAANADMSAYYVVQVKNRVPSTEAGEESLRKAFLAARGEIMFPYSPYGQLIQQERNAQFFKWREQLMAKYAFRMESPERRAARR